MSQELRAALVLFKYYLTQEDFDEDTNGKTIVCEEDSNWDTTNEVATRATKCKTFQTPQGPVHEISGSGVNVGDIAADEASMQDLKILCNANTSVWFRYANKTDRAIAAKEAVYCDGQGFFSTVNNQNNNGDGVSTFDWTFSPSGTVNLVPSA